MTAETAKGAQASLHVDAVLYQESGHYVAHALQLDLVSAGETEDETVDILMDVCITQIRHCLENNNLENLFKSAPPEIWQLWKGSTGPVIEKAVESAFEPKGFSISYAKAA